MSGLIVIVSPDPETRAAGARGLARLRVGAAPGWVDDTHESGDFWAGSCGPPARHSTQAVDRGDVTGAAGLLVATAGEVSNAGRIADEMGLVAPSPVELVAAAYRRWGAGLFEHLEGAYALAVCDPHVGSLVAGVDARAVGTLFALPLGDGIALTTGARACSVFPRFSARVDDTALAELLTLGWITRGRSLFDGVEGLPLGHHFEWTREGLHIVRHADDRDLLGGTLSGDDYVDRLCTTMRDLAAETFAADDIILPVTGGLDSRLLLAAAPADADPPSFSFGSPESLDVRVAARVAATRRLRHITVPVEPAYVARFAGLTAFLGEGRVNPVSNITGPLMDRIGAGGSFASGQGGELGRRLLRSRLMMPDWALLRASEAEFERRFVERVGQPCLEEATLRELIGGRAAEMIETGREGIREGLERSRGLAPVDRIDLHVGDIEFWEGRPWLAFAGAWLQARAPFYSRRWVEAVLSGAPDERLDDVARLRVIARLDPELGALPWSLTRLSCPASARLLLGLRAASGRVTARGRNRAPGVKKPSSGVQPGGAADQRLNALQHRLHPRIDERDEWLRSRSWGFACEILDSDRLADHGLFDRAAVGRLLQRHRAGEGLSRQLGILLGVELWMRIFVDGDEQTMLGADA